ncbi:MAG: hypothetical protein KAR57_00625 [Bacteroidales bacterium]|nr:hypothetical protein [Bacteroidales bacterium]
MKKSIGSYFSLELQHNLNNECYPEAIFLNTGRNALEYILRVLKIEKLFLPFFSCDALYKPLKEQNISYEFYNLDHNLVPIFDYSKLKKSEYFLYINYFGVKSKTVNELSLKIQNLIIDNSQAFFSKPDKKNPTFYSIRKFFGVTDGALLLNVPEEIEIGQDKSAGRMDYLLKRLENPVEEAYSTYQIVEEELGKLPLLLMSNITRSIFSSVNFETHRKKRNKNFKILHKEFGGMNQMDIEQVNGPLCYPLLLNNGSEIRKELIKERIFLPTYWPNVFEMVSEKSFEYQITNNLIAIPVDQRYDFKDMVRVISNIKKLL